MKKQVVRLTESDLHKIVEDSVKRVINEGAISAHDYISKLVSNTDFYSLEFIPNDEDITLDKQNSNCSFLPQGIERKGRNVYIDFDVFDLEDGEGYLGPKSINIKSITPNDMIYIIRLINKYK